MSLGYIFNEALAGFKRARLASFTSIFSLFISVLLLGVLARVSYNAYKVAKTLKKSIDVEVFLNDISDSATDRLGKKLMEDEMVNDVNYISKDSAAAIFKSEFGAEANSLAQLDFLPASYRLEINSEAGIQKVDSLVTKLQEYEGVQDVRFNQKLLQLMESRFKTVATAGTGLGILILLASLILVFNTIRLTIYAKRGLIKAMKLVGATNAFIRRPFVIEGLIQGLVGGLLAVLIMYIGFQYLLPIYVPEYGILEWPFDRWYYLCGAMLFLSMMMGFLGSQWAARKFIKETSISR